MKTPRVLSQLRVAQRLPAADAPDVIATRGDDPVGGAVRTAVLETLEDFDSFGGGSHELVAWELGLTPDDLAALWQELIRDGLLEGAGTDPLYTEAMFRLTAAGLEELRRTRAARETA